MKLQYEILVSYDIENNRSRKKVFEGLKDQGLYPVQKSVFVGKVNAAEKKAVQRILQKYLDKKQDRSFIITGDIIKQIEGLGIGYSKEDFYFNETSYFI